MSVKLATGPVTWGVDFADSPDNPPWTKVLDEIQRSGLGSLELGPVGYLPEAPHELREALGSRNLTAVGSFIFDNMHDAAERHRVVEEARRACRAIAAAGGSVRVIIDRPGKLRAPTAGRSGDAVRLGSAERANMKATLNAVADVAAEAGLNAAVHPHAGGFIEFADEIDWVAGNTSLHFCLDTGHLAYAGVDPAGAIRSYADRVTHVHFKDIYADVHAAVIAERIGFWDALARPIFCPVGHGVVDIGAVLQALAAIGYDGYATIEQDRVPGAGSPLDDLAASVAEIRSAQESIQRLPRAADGRSGSCSQLGNRAQ
jgi:inosose dehydratase